MDLQLQNKNALVFGSSMGIGRAIAESLLTESCQVCLSSRNMKSLSQTAKEIGAQHFLSCDLTKVGEASRATEQALNIMGNVDILICNSGGPQKNEFMHVNQEQWLEDFQNLILSCTESLKILLPIMKKNNFGRVIFITSVAGKEPLPGLTTSNVLRAGIEGLSKTISNEYAAFGITSNVIRPGFTDTDRLKELKLTEDRIRQMVPAGRLGRPQELGDLVSFLCSPRAAYITGQCISIDGGFQKSH